MQVALSKRASLILASTTHTWCLCPGCDNEHEHVERTCSIPQRKQQFDTDLLLPRCSVPPRLDTLVSDQIDIRPTSLTLSCAWDRRSPLRAVVDLTLLSTIYAALCHTQQSCHNRQLCTLKPLIPTTLTPHLFSGFASDKPCGQGLLISRSSKVPQGATLMSQHAWHTQTRTDCDMS